MKSSTNIDLNEVLRNGQAVLNKKRRTINQIKFDLFSEAVTSLLIRCFDEETNVDREVVQTLVENMIFRNGGYVKLKNDTKDKTYVLSECNKIVDKYSSIFEAQVDKCKDPDIFVIDVDIKNKFYKELEGLDMEKAEEVIAKRVRNNTYDYITNSLIAKDKIADIISDTKEKIEEMKEKRREQSTINGALQESARLKHAVMEQAGINKNPYGIVVKDIAMKAYTDENIKAKVSKNGKIDYECIESLSKTVYNTLEAAHGLKFIKLDIDTVTNQINL